MGSATLAGGSAHCVPQKAAVKSPEETHYLVQDALRCFSLVQVLNGAIASVVTLAEYLIKEGTATGKTSCNP